VDSSGSPLWYTTTDGSIGEDTDMTSKGWSHISLATIDMNATRAFYEGTLGFKAVRCDIIKVKEGGEIRHVFFDTGQGQLLAFMEPRGVPGAPVEFDGGLNRPLGMPEGVYHFAFEAGSQAELEAKRAELIAKGIQVTPVVDHDWAKSIYFKDPNGLMLEYSYISRDFTADDGVMQLRFEMSLFDASPILDFRDS
jgi:catechol 2,3-dioxygenase-like lactoylglutathione lyase family enzyme